MIRGLSRNRITNGQKDAKTYSISLTWLEFVEIWRAYVEYKPVGKKYKITFEKFLKVFEIGKEMQYHQIHISLRGSKLGTERLCGLCDSESMKGQSQHFNSVKSSSSLKTVKLSTVKTK